MAAAPSLTTKLSIIFKDAGGGGQLYTAVTGQLKTTPELLITNSRERKKRCTIVVRQFCPVLLLAVPVVV
jgi:hypothetical protein